MQASRYEEFFQENVVMTMEHLRLLTGRPRESILRDLRGIGYYSSYNERGKFYTLCDIPEFDGLGLWRYRQACFSVRRTLLDTVEHLVSNSDAGHTHDELRRMLGIGMQNSPYQLTMAGKIVRRQFGSTYVYFGKGSVGNQEARRETMPVMPVILKSAKPPNAQSRPAIDPILVIDILVAVLRGYETEDAALTYLHRMGSVVKEQHVAAVFRHYDICKKNSPVQV